MSLYELCQTPQAKSHGGEIAGSIVGGALKGAATGALLGSVVPVIGTGLGGAIGGGVGWLAGLISGINKADAADQQSSTYTPSQPQLSDVTKTGSPAPAPTGSPFPVITETKHQQLGEGAAEIALLERPSLHALHATHRRATKSLKTYSTDLGAPWYTVELECLCDGYGLVLEVDFESDRGRGLDVVDHAIDCAFNQLDVGEDARKKLVLFDDDGNTSTIVDDADMHVAWLRQNIVATRITSCIELVSPDSVSGYARLSSFGLRSNLHDDRLVPCRLTILIGAKERQSVRDRLQLLEQNRIAICTAASMRGVKRLDILAGNVFVEGDHAPLPILVLAREMLDVTVLEALAADLSELVGTAVNVRQVLSEPDL